MPEALWEQCWGPEVLEGKGPGKGVHGFVKRKRRILQYNGCGLIKRWMNGRREEGVRGPIS